MSRKFPSWGHLSSNTGFMRLWTSTTIGVFGRQIEALALPTVAIFLLKAGPFEIGILNGLEDLAWPLFGLFVGVWADRLRRRPMMIAGNLGRMIAVAAVPMAFLFAALHIYLLYIVSFTIGLCTVFFDVAYQSYLPTLIPRVDLIEGNAKLEISQEAARVAGPAVSGFLIKLIGAANAIIGDMLAFLSSTILIFSIRKEEPFPEPTRVRSFAAELREGANAAFGNPILRRIAASTATLNFGRGIFFAVFLLFMYQQLNLSFELVGFILAIGAVGLVLGAIVAPRIARRLGLGATLALSLIVGGAGLVGVPFAQYGPSIPTLVVLWILSNVLIPVYNINQISLRQAVTPDRLQGRMNATMRTLAFGTLAAGSFIGGVVGAYLGIILTMMAGALVSALAAIWILFPPVISLREIPTQPTF